MIAAMMRALFFVSLLLVPIPALAQTQQTPASNTQLLKPEELDQLGWRLTVTNCPAPETP